MKQSNMLFALITLNCITGALHAGGARRPQMITIPGIGKIGEDSCALGSYSATACAIGLCCVPPYLPPVLSTLSILVGASGLTTCTLGESYRRIIKMVEEDAREEALKNEFNLITHYRSLDLEGQKALYEKLDARRGTAASRLIPPSSHMA